MGCEVEPCLGVAVHRLAYQSRRFGPWVYYSLLFCTIFSCSRSGLVALFGPLSCQETSKPRFLFPFFVVFPLLFACIRCLLPKSVVVKLFSPFF